MTDNEVVKDSSIIKTIGSGLDQGFLQAYT